MELKSANEDDENGVLHVELQDGLVCFADQEPAKAPKYVTDQEKKEYEIDTGMRSNAKDLDVLNRTKKRSVKESPISAERAGSVGTDRLANSLGEMSGPKRFAIDFVEDHTLDIQCDGGRLPPEAHRQEGERPV